MLQVVQQPNNLPTTPLKMAAPIQPTLSPKVTLPQQPVLAPKVAPVQNPTLSPQMGQASLPQISSIGTSDNQQPYTPKMSLVEFGQLIKQRYPIYADKSDLEIAQAMLTKFPQYQDRIYTPSQDNQSDPSLGGFIKNIGTSGFGAVKNLLSAAIHPIDTIEGIAKILGGATASTFTLGQKSTPEFDGFINFLKDRYGTVDNIKKTAYEDPVGFLIDVSTVLDAGGSALAKVGDVSKISEISKAGEIASKVGEVTNPINMAGKVAKPIISKTGNVASEILGFGTGAGGGAVKEAFNNPSKGYYEGLRGKVSPEAIVSEAKQALGEAKSNRATTYQNQLAEVKNITSKLDLSPLQSELDNQLNKFGIKVKKGTLDFSSSTISDTADKTKVQQAFDDITRWSKKPENLTPAGVDTLKRRLGNLFSPTSDVRALTTSLKKITDKILKDNVPGYTEMTKSYEQASNFITDVTKGLSLSDKASTDTALRKLSSALKQNNEFRTELVKQLEDIGGKDLTGKIAGYNLSSVLPRGLFGKLVEGGTLLSAFQGMTHLISPATLAALATTSPRLVGEVLGGLGISKQVSSEIITTLQKSRFAKPLKQLGKAGYYQKKAQ